MNYESEFRDFLIKNLKKKFQIQDETNLLFYLFLRYLCLFDGTALNIASKDFMQFIMRQLYIIDEPDGVVFNDQFFTYYFAQENSLANIYCEWYFQVFDSISLDLNGNQRQMKDEAKKAIAKIRKNATKKNQKYKNSTYHQEILKYFRLEELNAMLNVSLMDVPDLDSVNQLDIRLWDEECLERYLQAEQFNTTNTKVISEASLRDFLYVNLELLEIGLKPIGKEVVTEEGRIDILAKDKDGHYVIIELKTESDKRLIWQCLYYPEVLPKNFPVSSPIRVITVCPEYPEYLLTVLRRLPLVEMFQYESHSTNSKIENLKIYKI